MTDRGVGALALCLALALALVPMACEHRDQRGADPLPRAEAGAPFAFAREIERVAVLELPPSSRPASAESTTTSPIQGPFNLVRTVDGVSVYVAMNPVRPRSLFFFKPLPGMEVQDQAGKKLKFSTGDKKLQPRTWSFDSKTIILRLAADAPAPKSKDFTLTYPQAMERENALNLSLSGLAPKAFAARSLQLDEDTRTGLLLPAPATAAWDVRMPPAATLQLDAVILPPEVRSDLASGGAKLIVEIEEGGDKTEVLRESLEVGTWEALRVDLSDWAGRDVRVAFRTEGGDDNNLDYVFLADPTLYTPTTQPRKLLLVFLDTVRRDHLGLYGYERDTTPKLDAWSKGAFVFDNARSVAPWTLPSSRTILSGRQPERWTDGPTLQDRLAKAGWATGAFVGNVYLSSNFEMANGWSQHTCSNWPIAEVQVDRAKRFMARHQGRDVAMVLHTMDAHVPYTEPAAYRNLWAGEAPPGLGDQPLRTAILAAARDNPALVKDWLIDRYDQNLRYLDDQVSALIGVMGPDTTVVIFADHGEEFWDHGDFEHGHSLYDELLRVPFIVYDPALAAGRSAAPVSLLDLTPTVLELLGMPAEGLDGRSLVPLARGDATAEAYFSARPQAVGRPLYGSERWGVLSENLKWTTHDGDAALYDLLTDAAETQNLIGQAGLPDQAALRADMAEAMGTEVPLSWRLAVGRTGATGNTETLEIQHPLGISAAWLGGDPLDGAPMTLHGPDAAGVVHLALPPGKTGLRELYIVPVGPPEQLGGLTLSARGTTETAPVELWLALPTGSDSAPLWSTRIANRPITVTWGFAPVPTGSTALDAMDPELEAALQAIGYTEREE